MAELSMTTTALGVAGPLDRYLVGPKTNKLPRMNLSADGPSGSIGPTPHTGGGAARESETEQGLFKCRAPECDRTFQSARGRGVHEQRAHKDWYDGNQLELHPSKKAPWTEEELALLARQEARLSLEGARYMNQALMPLFQERTLEAIKGQRRNPAYKARVQALVQEMQSVSDERPPAVVGPGEDGADLTSRVAEHLSALDPLEGDDFHSEHLSRICENILRWTRDRVFEELEIYLLQVFPPNTVGPSDGCRRGPTTVLSKRRERRAEYARTQKAWKRNPCNCLRAILDQKKGAQIPPKDLMVSFWRTVMTNRDDSSPGIGQKANEVKAWEPIDQIEMLKSFPALTTSPGPDGLTARQLKAIPYGITLRILNLFLLCGRIPKHLLESKTTLIPKKNDAREPGDFRPITVSSVLTRTFHKILARRLGKMVVLDDRQRAFMPIDGCSRNIFELDMLLRYHRQRFKPLFIASIDIAKAFDSVTHNTIKDTLVKKGIPGPMVGYIMHTYKDGHTRLRCGGWVSEPIGPTCGVRQGDPLSPIIFNMVMDGLLQALPSEVGTEIAGKKFSAFAFADDLVLVGQTQTGLQTMIDKAADYLSGCGLTINSGKTFTVAIRNVPHLKKSVVDRATTFRCQGITLPAVGREDQWRYLGVPFTPEGRLLCRSEDQLREAISALGKAPLKPQQRLFAMRVMVLPGLYHQLNLGGTNLSRLKKIDTLTRAAVRKWLSLPHDVPNAYIHANFKDGGLSIPSMRWLMPLQRKQRLQSLLEDGVEPRPYHSQEIQIAERRLADGAMRITNNEELNARWAGLLHGSCDGAALVESNKVLQQHQWTIEGTRFLSGRDYLNAIKLRINAMPTRARTTRGRREDRLCRAGCGEIETLNHVLQRCHRTHSARVERHNAVVAYVRRALEQRYGVVDEEPRLVTPQGLRKPDLVAARDGEAIIVDAQVVSERADLDMAHQRKIDYYQQLQETVRVKYGVEKVTLTSVTLSSRGIWSRKSAQDLVSRKIIKAQELKIISTRAIIGGLSAFWMFNRTTSVRRRRTGIG